MEIKVDDYQWVFNCFGSGKKVLLAFHGYGQDNHWFRHHEDLFGKEFKIYAVDLAFHGLHEQFSKGLLFDSSYSEKWLSEILKALNLEKIGLMGYSIGARKALSMAAWNPDLISELWLLAPDGLPVSGMYKLLTNTKAGHLLFKSFISSPGFSLGLIKLLEKLHIIHNKVANFYRTEIGSRPKRQKLFDTWMAYRKAQPEFRVLQERMNNDRLSITCILGKEDRVIPCARTKKFVLRTLIGTNIIELDLGHNLLSDKGARLLEHQLFFKQESKLGGKK